MKKTILVFLIALGCMISFSVSSMAACSDKLCKGKVVKLRLHDNILYIGTDGDESQLNCTSPAGTYVSIPTGDPSFMQKYSLLLTAVSLDKTVTLRIKELSRICNVDYIIMDNP
mgnify:CR=1 FL=1